MTVVKRSEGGAHGMAGLVVAGSLGRESMKNLDRLHWGSYQKGDVARSNPSLPER